MKSRREFLAVIAISITLFLIRCAEPIDSGVETTNGGFITASASSIAGSTPPHSLLCLSDSGYIPHVNKGISLTATADITGNFSFDSLAKKVYSLVVRDAEGRTAALLQKIALPSDTQKIVRRFTLQPTGSIRGAAVSGKDSKRPLLVYQAGTRYYAIIPSSGNYLLDRIPCGEFTLRAAIIDTGSNTIPPETDLPGGALPVTVKSGLESLADTLKIP